MNTQTKSTANGVQKRVRRSKDQNETPQRARKRALDREAQRAFREKTKNYIAHLEQTVEACKAQNEGALVTQLLAQNAELYGTIERLRKIISDIFAAAQPEILGPQNKSEAPAQSDGQGKPPKSPSGSQSPAADTISVARDDDLSSIQPAEEINVGGSDALATFGFNSFNAGPVDLAESPRVMPATTSMHATEVEASSGVAPMETTMALDTAASVFDIPQPMAPFPIEPRQFVYDTMPQLIGQDSMTDRIVSDDRFVSVENLWSPMSMQRQMTSFFGSELETSNLWSNTNRVYSRMFGITPLKAAAARNSDGGSIFKAIKQGWDSLSPREQEDPVVQILREYDELVCQQLDEVNRMAIAYKNHLLIKYYLNLDSADLERMPHWQRPRPSQRAKKHPILIDFFAWPGLRERMIRGEMSIESNRFAAAYIKYFRFLWPFSFEDTYQYCAATDTYTASPLFERYHRDLRCWTMEEKFFWEYPQLIEDISSPKTWTTDTDAPLQNNSWLSDLMT